MRRRRHVKRSVSGRKRLRSLRLLAVLALGVTCTMVVAACGGGEGGGNGQKQKTIGVSLPSEQGPFFIPEIYGQTDEGKKLGYKVLVSNAGGYDRLSVQTAQVEDYITRRVDGIIIEPIDPTAIQPVLRKAQDAGIKVVAVSLPKDTPLNVAIVDFNHYLIGQRMGEAMIKALPNGGSIVAETGPAGAFWTTSRYQGFQDSLKGHNINVLGEQASENSVDQGVKLTEDFMSKYPQTQGIYAVDNGMGVGAAQVLKRLGKAGQVKVVTAVLDHDIINGLKDGTIYAAAALQPVLIGRTEVRILDKVFKGQSVDKQTIVPVQVVTKENVDTIPTDTLFAPDGFRPPG
jgi:ABC-type sugar transport system substrate-binding protein